MDFPDDLYYTREHIWVRVTATRATVGVTEYAQQEMGEILFVDLPDEGAQIEQDEVFGSLESAKTVAELYAPVSGEVVSFNKDLEEEPSLINDDPYGKGWVVAFEMDDPEELEGLLTASAYEDLLEKK